MKRFLAQMLALCMSLSFLLAGGILSGNLAPPMSLGEQDRQPDAVSPYAEGNAETAVFCNMTRGMAAYNHGAQPLLFRTVPSFVTTALTSAQTTAMKMATRLGRAFRRFTCKAAGMARQGKRYFTSAITTVTTMGLLGTLLACFQGNGNNGMCNFNPGFKGAWNPPNIATGHSANFSAVSRPTTTDPVTVHVHSSRPPFYARDQQAGFLPINCVNVQKHGRVATRFFKVRKNERQLNGPYVQFAPAMIAA